MKTLAFLLFTLCFVCVGQAQQVQGEPAALTKAREKYQRDIVPITKAYLEKLEALKKEFGAKGDVPAVNAVQEEIEEIKPPPPDKKTTLEGAWYWRDRKSVV